MDNTGRVESRAVSRRAYLLGLAIRRGGVLATLDERIGMLMAPKSAEKKALEFVN